MEGRGENERNRSGKEETSRGGRVEWKRRGREVGKSGTMKEVDNIKSYSNGEKK